MLDHFQSPDVQNRVKLELQSLNFDNFVSEQGTEAKALSKNTSYINNKAQHCPLNFRSNEMKIEFLKNAIIKHP